ncbi:toxin-antitoxin system TumE family protein [Candidatus Thiothrix anitrata]|uniref:Transcriptional regulator n=1 Tax=Candidatus Thiothrix anitrata TaxID=2823902 RepID=A0ABX7X623_9GAMM|nr:DUF6516 family protein [Candidatus Thiothrix anitrata]QTR50717.1 hypothetical protein J8380_03875 [Candidatus Thiothrix anitrata]
MPKKKSQAAASFTRIIDERYAIPKRKGGGSVKIEAWADTAGNIVKYNIAYINHALFMGDNGRVIGYDNAHDYHHRHHFGDIFPVEDFTTYEEIVERFERDIAEYLT